MKRTRTLASAALIALLSIILPLSVFGKADKKIKFISLRSTQLDTASRFAGIKILNFTARKDTIGEGNFGFNGRSTICFEQAEELNSYLSKHLVFNPSASDTLVIALYAYCFEIDLTGAGINAFHFDADCYIGSNGKYRSAGPMRFCREVKDRSKVEEYISAVTDSVVVKRMLTRGTVDEQVVDEHFIRNGRAAEIAKIPVYNETVKSGLYRTAKDFFNNTPSETGEIRWVGSDMMSFNLTTEDGSKTRMKAKEFFAICDKGTLYKASGKGLVKVKFVNSNFYFPVLLNGVSDLTAYDKYGAGMGLGSLVLLLENPAKETKAYNCKIDFRTGAYYPVLASEMAWETTLTKQ
ncbi:hypothetical protein [Taibaiella soli]|uniref:Uncharacterized protein n=1 Tax=Taibaiella soli TaxID=1649169 RepID=A0A2W2AHH3_9BACT|nr:hypothetical protein [Taibaiella soli]PZF72992.1 hypothetical protein DN068_11320 [Taibaiella soli]